MMAVIEGYTVPDTLEECQAAIVVLLQQAKRTGDEMAADQSVIHEEEQRIEKDETQVI